MSDKDTDFDFPNPDEKAVSAPVTAPVSEEDDPIEVEVVDETPPEDRNRKPSEPPPDVTDDELTEYSEKVKKRLQHFSKGYHDERRAKEQAMRERQELERYTRALMEENNKLKGNVDKSQSALVEQAKKVVESEVDAAKRAYKEAYDAGDTDALLAAQDALTQANIRLDKVKNIRVTPLQQQPAPVQQPVTPPAAPPPPSVDERAQQWQKRNQWFGSDDAPEMTAFALGLDMKLRREGIDPRSDEYYAEIDSRMRKTFPDAFRDKGSENPATRQTSTTVVAPATRSTAPKKIRLSQDAVNLARKLGITPEQYAREVAKLEKRNG